MLFRSCLAGSNAAPDLGPWFSHCVPFYPRIPLAYESRPRRVRRHQSTRDRGLLPPSPVLCRDKHAFCGQILCAQSRSWHSTSHDTPSRPHCLYCLHSLAASHANRRAVENAGCSKHRAWSGHFPPLQYFDSLPAVHRLCIARVRCM